MMEIQRLVQRRSAVTCGLGMAAALLVLIHIGLQLVKYWTGHDYIFGLVNLFHLDKERNIPTAFSTLLLLSAAALLWFIRTHEKAQGSRDVPRWTVLAIGFLYMAMDEFGHIHELLIVRVQHLLGDGALGVFYYAWVVPAIVVVLVLAVFFLGFLRRLPARTGLVFSVAAMLFIGGAIGVEMLEGRHDELYGEQDLTYIVYVIVEESLEMAGVIVFIHALLQYIAGKHEWLWHGTMMGDGQRARGSQPSQAGALRGRSDVR